MGLFSSIGSFVSTTVGKVVVGTVAAATAVGGGIVAVTQYTTQKVVNTANDVTDTIKGKVQDTVFNAGKLVLVNGTDKDWKLVSKHSYQMNKWDNSFPDVIKSGEMKTANIEFGHGIVDSASDDGGEARYQLDGTDKTFEIQATRKGEFGLQVKFINLSTKDTPVGKTINMGLAKALSNDGSRYFILTGKDGNYTGNGLNTANWMRDNMDVIGDQRLMEICIPGSHDSGMSEKSWNTTGVTDNVVITQTRNVGEQLELGSRFLDIRPGSRKINDKTVYFTQHMQDERGATGQPIDKVIEQVNNFTNSHNELVIINLSHAINIDDKGNDFDQAEWESFLNYLKTNVKNLVIAPADADIPRMKLNELLKENQEVILLLADKTFSKYSEELKKKVNIPIIMPTELHGKGFFTADNFEVFDKYADKKNWDEMAADQKDKLEKQGLQYFLLSWTLTQQYPNKAEAVLNVIGANDNILQLAQEANWQQSEMIYPMVGTTTFPNILYTDDIHNDQPAALAMAINWKRKIQSNYGPKPLAVVYTDAKFAGASEDFHEAGTLFPIEKYVKAKNASSIKVASGYKAILYENADGTGNQIVIDGDTEYYDKKSDFYKNLTEYEGFKGMGILTAPGFSFNDKASSIRIERKNVETKAFAKTLVGSWMPADGKETLTFTENSVHSTRINEDKPYNTSSYKVVNEKSFEATGSDGRAWQATITFEDNGNTLVWHNLDNGYSNKFKRVKPE